MRPRRRQHDLLVRLDQARYDLGLAQVIARHASELVDRLLRERNALRALLHDYFPRVAHARVRLQQWQEGDGTKPREVLADLERILG